MFNERHEPEFNVYGDSNILKDMVINIESYKGHAKYHDYLTSKVQTQLYKGKQLHFENDYIFYYTIYFSYKDWVGTLSFDNVHGYNNRHINSIYISKTENGIAIKYYALDSDIHKGYNRASGLATPLEDFFIKSNITTKSEQNVYKEKFFNFFEPSIQEYKLEPLGEKEISDYMALSLENKKKYKLPLEYIKQISLPEDELNEIIQYYNEHHIE